MLVVAATLPTCTALFHWCLAPERQRIVVRVIRLSGHVSGARGRGVAGAHPSVAAYVIGSLVVFGVLSLGACSDESPGESQSNSRLVQSSAAPGSSSWQSGVSAGDTLDTESARISQIIDSMTLEQKVAGLLMVHFPGTDAQAFATWTDNLQPAGIILMSDNTQTGPEIASEIIRAAQDRSELPLLVSVDQEGGVVSRFDADPAAGPMELRTMSTAEVEAQQKLRAQFLKEAGFNTNFGIVADITDDPNSFIYPRVLGESPEAASGNVAASVRGGNDGGIYSTLKHFPGHGAAPGDSHHMLPQTDLPADVWAVDVAPPFSSGIDAGADLVMMGHLVFDQVSAEPASLSPEWHQILRDDLGFDGVIVTDDMRMLVDSGLEEFQNPGTNVVRALKSGSDLVLYVFGSDDPVDSSHQVIASVVDAVNGGELSERQIDESLARVLKLRLAAR